MTRTQTQTAAPTKRLPTRKSKKLHMTTVINCSTEEKFNVLKEKNRQSAQRSRDNRKRYLVGLQNKISELTLQNEYLKKQLSLSHCSRSGNNPMQQSNTMNSGSQDQPKIAEDSPNQYIFERVSLKSFASCSNFLILSLVMLFCVFGYVDVTGQVNKPNNQLLYSYDHLQTAMSHLEKPIFRCADCGIILRLSELNLIQETGISISTQNLTGELGPGEVNHSTIQPTLEDEARLPINTSKLFLSK